MTDRILQLKKQLSSGRPVRIEPAVTSEAADCLQQTIRSLGCGQVNYHVCPDRDCRTAFWLEINLGLGYELVVELSTFGKYARAYWKRRRLVSTEYSPVIPPVDQVNYGTAFRKVQQAISQCGVSLLSSEELDERVPLSSDELNPSDEATVGSLTFASEYH